MLVQTEINNNNYYYFKANYNCKHLRIKNIMNDIRWLDEVNNKTLKYIHTGLSYNLIMLIIWTSLSSKVLYIWLGIVIPMIIIQIDYIVQQYIKYNRNKFNQWTY